MELHNTAEEIVIRKVEEIFNTIEKEGNQGNICTCNQCRVDTACYVLNRTQPYYLVSYRGINRVQRDNVEQQQKDADITVLVYEGIRQVNHNQRTSGSHTVQPAALSAGSDKPVFNIPTIVGRLFSGENFAPLSDATIDLLRENALVPMKDGNWHNPYNLVIKSEGTYTFWPSSIPASAVDEHGSFEFSLRINSPEYETMTHIFKVPVISEFQTSKSFMLQRTFKLPDLYMFPPGEADKKRGLD